MKIQFLTALSLVSAPALAAGTVDNLQPVSANLPSLERSLVPTASNLPGALVGGPTRVASGVRNGLSWTARSTIIGQTPTSDAAPAGPGNPPNPPINSVGGGDPIYFPTANKRGTVALIMEYQNGSRFICSGSVIGGGMSIATAAHCVSSGGGVKDANLVKTTAYFYKGDPNERTPFQTGGVAIEVSKYIVNPNYTGQVIDQNDIAILRLETAAPSWANRYELYTDDIFGKQFNVAGYGTRSTVGGAAGNTAPAGARTGWLREGDNVYDYTWGDPRFGGFFTDLDSSGENFFYDQIRGPDVADYQFSYISDFDNGLAAQNQAGRIGAAVGGGTALSYSSNGLSPLTREVGIAGGDSGGPGFIDGKLASINSYGLTFGTAWGDFGGGLNSGWGEFSGYVPVFIHTDFINAATAVPEPSSWAMLIAGFGLVGATMRRRRTATVAA